MGVFFRVMVSSWLVADGGGGRRGPPVAAGSHAIHHELDGSGVVLTAHHGVEDGQPSAAVGGIETVSRQARSCKHVSSVDVLSTLPAPAKWVELMLRASSAATVRANVEAKRIVPPRGHWACAIGAVFAGGTQGAEPGHPPVPRTPRFALNLLWARR